MGGPTSTKSVDNSRARNQLQNFQSEKRTGGHQTGRETQKKNFNIW